jgi:large subunit ribosomal protein L4
MASISLKNRSGADAGTVELDDAVFGIEPNVPVMHQVVTAQLAARRAGTQSTKTRAEVRGGGAKPWKQKGTGRARQGSTRSPQWSGGGVALGPKPRSYAQRTPKKMIRLALRSALSDRASEGKVVVVDDWGFDAPRTKDAAAALSALGIDGRALLVLSADDVATWKSFRNIDSVHIIEPGQLNAFDVLVADWILFTRATLPDAAGEPPAKVKAERPKPAAKTAAPKPSKRAASAPVDAGEESPSTDPASEADDVASDLPNRPPTDPSDRSAPVDPTDRVKSAANKPDPRFEAARQKAANKEALRAKADAARTDEDGDEAGDESADAEAAPAAESASGGFSFNQTTGKDGE